MKTRPLTEYERDLIGRELDNASYWDGHNEKAKEKLNDFINWVFQNKIRIVIEDKK
jgi:hypothetical protein